MEHKCFTCICACITRKQFMTLKFGKLLRGKIKRNCSQCYKMWLLYTPTFWYFLKTFLQVTKLKDKGYTIWTCEHEWLMISGYICLWKSFSEMTFWLFLKVGKKTYLFSWERGLTDLLIWGLRMHDASSTSSFPIKYVAGTQVDASASRNDHLDPPVLALYVHL